MEDVAVKQGFLYLQQQQTFGKVGGARLPCPGLGRGARATRNSRGGEGSPKSPQTLTGWREPGHAPR